MSVPAIISKAKTMGVRLSLNGDKVKLRGPTDAIEAIKSEIAAHKPEIMAHLRAASNDPADCTGALIDPSGGAYLPWGPYLSADDVRRMRDELVAMIEELCDIECWPETSHDDVLSRAIRGPLADLLPNLHYFAERLTAARASVVAEAALDRRTWRGDGLDNRRA